jgi:hypothetical protein
MCLASGDAIADGFKMADDIYADALKVTASELADRLLAYAYSEREPQKRAAMRLAAVKLLQQGGQW